MSVFGLLIDAEQIQYDQQCAIRCLSFLHDLLLDDIMFLEASGAPVATGHLQELGEAMYSVGGTLFRLNQALAGAVEEEYQKRRGQKPPVVKK